MSRVSCVAPRLSPYRVKFAAGASTLSVEPLLMDVPVGESWAIQGTSREHRVKCSQKGCSAWAKGRSSHTSR